MNPGYSKRDKELWRVRLRQWSSNDLCPLEDADARSNIPNPGPGAINNVAGNWKRSIYLCYLCVWQKLRKAFAEKLLIVGQSWAYMLIHFCTNTLLQGYLSKNHKLNQRNCKEQNRVVKAFNITSYLQVFYTFELNYCLTFNFCWACNEAPIMVIINFLIDKYSAETGDVWDFLS